MQGCIILSPEAAGASVAAIAMTLIPAFLPVMMLNRILLIF